MFFAKKNLNILILSTLFILLFIAGGFEFGSRRVLSGLKVFCKTNITIQFVYVESMCFVHISGQCHVSKTIKKIKCALYFGTKEHLQNKF